MSRIGQYICTDYRALRKNGMYPAPREVSFIRGRRARHCCQAEHSEDPSSVSPVNKNNVRDRFIALAAVTCLLCQAGQSHEQMMLWRERRTETREYAVPASLGILVSLGINVIRHPQFCLLVTISLSMASWMFVPWRSLNLAQIYRPITSNSFATRMVARFWYATHALSSFGINSKI